VPLTTTEAAGGADCICFAGGIGENSPIMREMIISGLEKLGIQVDMEKNSSLPSSGGEISREGSPVRVFVVPTDEELVIARDTVRALMGVTKDPSAPLVRRNGSVGAAK
jgi:acetate kinase